MLYFNYKLKKGGTLKLKAFIYHNGIDVSEVPLDVYEPVGGQTFKIPVVNLKKMKTRINRNSSWKQQYEDAVKAVEEGNAINEDSISNYVNDITEAEALTEAALQDGKTFTVNDRRYAYEPIHLIREDGTIEKNPYKSQSKNIRFKATIIAFRELMLPIMVLVLGLLAIFYTYRLEDFSPLPFIWFFSGILFVSGIALFIKSLRLVLDYLRGWYRERIDTLRNVISFKVKVEDPLSDKSHTYTYYFADTDCFRCIPLSKSMYKKLKGNKEGRPVAVISSDNKIQIVSVY